LDNGELFWPAFLVAEVLKEKFPNETKLQQRWENFWKRMAKNSATIFYAGNGDVRAVTKMTNQKLPLNQNNYTSGCGGCLLNDPYEGELFVVMMILFGDLPQSEKDLIWSKKLRLIQLVNFNNKGFQNITVQRGFWFSSHEQWKYMMLPYYESKTNWRVYKNGERARTFYALLKKSPGMWASVNGPVISNSEGFPYYSDCGIAQISFEPVTHDSVLTPYSAFPLFLVSPKHAAVWLHNMIQAPSMQNCFGTTESLFSNGSYFAPLVTWDSKVTTVLAALNGTSTQTAKYLQKRNLLNTFVNMVESLWSQVFTLPLSGENLDYQLPRVTVPINHRDFTSCSVISNPCKID